MCRVAGDAMRRKTSVCLDTSDLVALDPFGSLAPLLRPVQPTAPHPTSTQVDLLARLFDGSPATPHTPRATSGGLLVPGMSLFSHISHLSLFSFSEEFIIYIDSRILTIIFNKYVL